MSNVPEVNWAEGMFLRPQHLQLSSRHFVSLVESAMRGVQPFFWGFRRLEVDGDQLETFTLALRSDGSSGPRFVSFAWAEAATLTTGLLRMGAGAHSWEDVLVGWVVGHGVGALVAMAHPMKAAPVDGLEAGTGVTAQALRLSPAAMFRWSGTL